MRHFTYYCFGEAEYINSWGKLSYLPSNSSDADSFVDEMATLLTVGRLNGETRQIIANEIEKINDDEFGLRLAQQLMITSPEFHSTDLMKFNGQERNVPEPEAIESTESYKAVVYLFLDRSIPKPRHVAL